jgi:hypothetical protein
VGSLARESRPKALRRFAQGFKTGALAELRVSDDGWRTLRPSSAIFERFTRPKDL